MHILSMIGEILIGLFFISMGSYNIKNRAHLMESLRGKNCIIPEWSLLTAVALEILGGAMVVFHYAAMLGAIYLIAFTVVTSYLLHPFWAAEEKEKQKHLLILANHVAIIGGLLLILSMQM